MEFDKDDVLALYKSRTANKIFKVRLLKTETGWAIYGQLPKNPYIEMEEHFDDYSRAVETWNELMASIELPF